MGINSGKRALGGTSRRWDGSGEGCLRELLLVFENGRMVRAVSKGGIAHWV
jgi:hypothetical protein